METEAATIRAFVPQPLRARMLELLSLGEARRSKLTGLLSHRVEFHAAVATEIKGTAEEIEAELRRRGAPDRCHVMSDDGDLDGRELPLSEALEAVVGWTAALVICVPGELAYYEGEDLGRRLVLGRSPA